MKDRKITTTLLEEMVEGKKSYELHKSLATIIKNAIVEWKDIPNHCYQVSNTGLVRPMSDVNCVRLVDIVNGRVELEADHFVYEEFVVKELVVNAFRKEPYSITFIDGDENNLHINNLRYG